MAWYCIYTRSRCEFLAAGHLVGQDFEVFLPTYLKRYKGRKAKELPLFTRYLFAAFDLQRDPWRKINSTLGVSYLFLSSSHVPLPVPDGLIEFFKSAAFGDVFPDDRTGALRIHEGCKVRVVGGPLKAEFGDTSLEGICSWAEGDRLKLLICLLGRMIEVKFHLGDVELVV